MEIGGSEMLPGMTFTIEPIIKAGSTEYKVWDDNWTIEALDQLISAQKEHTILITNEGFEVLTMMDSEKSIFKN
jgi:methionyl aminopeptidase